MPLLSLRPGHPDRDLRRRSIVEPYNLFRHQEQLPPSSSSTDYLPQRRDAPSNDGVTSDLAESVEDEAPAADAPPSPPVQKQTANHRRFSMLRFRHASDPQLSYNAKHDHDEPVPPLPAMPEGMCRFGRMTRYDRICCNQVNADGRLFSCSTCNHHDGTHHRHRVAAAEEETEFPVFPAESVTGCAKHGCVGTTVDGEKGQSGQQPISVWQSTQLKRQL